MLSQGVSGDISTLHQRHRRHTSFLPIDVRLDIGLLERPPFEVFPIAAALDLAFGALLASRLLFAAFQSFGFASHAAYEVIPSVHAQPWLMRLCCCSQVPPKTLRRAVRIYRCDSLIAWALVALHYCSEPTASVRRAPSSSTAFGLLWRRAAGRLARPVAAGWGCVAGRRRVMGCECPPPSVCAFRLR